MANYNNNPLTVTITGPITFTPIVGYKMYTVTINQQPNQTITVTSRDSVNTTPISHTETFECVSGTQCHTTVTANTGYNPGTLSQTDFTVIKSDTSVSVTPATLKTYTVTITQSANQTITVLCNGVNHTSSFTARHGDTFTASISASSGYKPGSLNMSSGTITSNISISASSAVADVYDVITANITAKYNFDDPSGNGDSGEETIGVIGTLGKINSSSSLTNRMGKLISIYDIYRFDYSGEHKNSALKVTGDGTSHPIKVYIDNGQPIDGTIDTKGEAHWYNQNVFDFYDSTTYDIRIEFK